MRLALNRHFSYVSFHNFKCQSYNLHKMIWGGTVPFFFFFFLFCSLLLENWNEFERLAMSIEKKKHNLKTENYVLFSRFTDDPSQRYSLSDGPEGLFWRCKGGAKIQFLPKEKKKQQQQQQNRQQDIKTLLLIQENQIFQANECSAFLFHGKYESLGL